MTVPTKTNPTNNLPAAFGKADNYSADEFYEGVGPSFGVLSIRGSKFRLKRGGEERLMTDKDGDALSSINVILLRANPARSKVFYKAKYEEGSDSAPDCWSVDGIRPDAAVTNKQAETCGVCPNNVRGSVITESGAKAKACADTRRVAVLLYPQVDDDPVMLRVPPTSLKPLADYARSVDKRGIPLYAVVTKLRFDSETAYPKLNFVPVGIVTDEDEAKRIVEARASDITTDILYSGAAEALDTATQTREDAEDKQAARAMAAQTPAKAFAEAEPDDDTETESAPINVKQAPEGKVAQLFDLPAEDDETAPTPKPEPKPEPKPKPKQAKAKAAQEEPEIPASLDRRPKKPEKEPQTQEPAKEEKITDMLDNILGGV